MKNFSYHKISSIGYAVLLLIFGGLIGWMFIAKVDLTVQAPGEIIVKTYKKAISHPKGGLIGEIYVKEGDVVKEGDKLIQIKSDELISQLNSNRENYIYMLAEKERILAELEHKKPTFSEDIPEEIRKSQIDIYNNRISDLTQTIQDLEVQIQDQQNTIKFLKDSLETKKTLLVSYEKEYEEKSELYKKDFIDKDTILELSRKITQLKNEIDSILSELKQKEIFIKGLKNKIELTKSKYEKEILNRLSEIDLRLPGIKSNIEVLENGIKENLISAPSDGIITDMRARSKGELINPHSPILYIVPKTQEFVIEAKVSPVDIDKVKVKEKAEVNFPSYVDPAAKPVEAIVTYVSADIIKNEKESYYKIYLKFTEKGLKTIRKNGFEIIPGMPVVAFIKAGERSFASYILLPMEQLFKGAFHAN